MIYEPIPYGKVCRKCQQWKTINCFYRIKGKYRGTCKPCYRPSPEKEKQQSLKQRTEHPERIKQIQKKYRDSHDEEMRERGKQYRTENPDKVHQTQKNYRLAHPEVMAQKQVRWRKNHPDISRANAAKYSKIRREAEGEYTDDQVIEQYRKQHGLCFWCSEPVDYLEFQTDHIIPISRWGTNWISNIVCACVNCNSKKYNKLPFVEWQPPKCLGR